MSQDIGFVDASYMVAVMLKANSLYYIALKLKKWSF